ncbi:hypothetical protein GHA01_07160 [Novacetimonas hansenii]|uniref:Secreted protein n=1 Tax=Novacetimonas hansenii TaxID=436 RepID=A0ABQ0SCI8_NOVHA|nr:hypothetical protein Gaha_0088_008 [Novacetimonas hansenii JCM 7643]GEC62867.1 hypothetical protein GHA01_07160 [Novacetimonas hansenii]
MFQRKVKLCMTLRFCILLSECHCAQADFTDHNACTAKFSSFHPKIHRLKQHMTAGDAGAAHRKQVWQGIPYGATIPEIIESGR